MVENSETVGTGDYKKVELGSLHMYQIPDSTDVGLVQNDNGVLTTILLSNVEFERLIALSTMMAHLIKQA